MRAAAQPVPPLPWHTAHRTQCPSLSGTNTAAVFCQGLSHACPDVLVCDLQGMRVKPQLGLHFELVLNVGVDADGWDVYVKGGLHNGVKHR